MLVCAKLQHYNLITKEFRTIQSNFSMDHQFTAISGSLIRVNSKIE